METQVKCIEYFNEHWYKIQLPEWKEPDYFPSITTKLGIIDKPFLRQWYGDIGSREASLRVKEAQESGSKIHKAWQVMTDGGAVIYQSKRAPQFTQDEIEELNIEYVGNIQILFEQDEQVDVWKLKEWHKRLKPIYLYNEQTLFSLAHREAGTCDKIIRIEKDGLFEINGAKPLLVRQGVYVVDLKTGSTADDNSYMQISAYREMAIQMGLFLREEFSGGIIVHTGAKTKSGIRGLATLLRTTEELDQDYLDYRHASNLWLRKHKDDRPDIFEFPAVITLEELKNGINI